ncbi:MAG TPA: hypothetical protein VGY48_01495 [Vicinamibacterales bacterium]|jgi:hypothetical protein|nr:hypothetical protein [Vicinamibacterales bacterium]
MTESSNRPRVPGTTLLKIARLLFDESLLSAAVQPTISDLQREVADAGSSRLKRLRAQRRGYCAFWTLTLVAPFASCAPGASPARDARGVARPDAVARLGAGAIVLTLLVILGPVFGASVAVVTAAGALLAIVIHAWYQRHPSDIPAPIEPQRRAPQINFSSTEVAGNIGGLIFALGSVLIVAVALPALIWFLFGSTLAACVLAWGLVAWHKSHPTRGLPENLIVLR